jgi:hypothetical protein
VPRQIAGGSQAVLIRALTGGESQLRCPRALQINKRAKTKTRAKRVEFEDPVIWIRSGLLFWRVKPAWCRHACDCVRKNACDETAARIERARGY